MDKVIGLIAGNSECPSLPLEDRTIPPRKDVGGFQRTPPSHEHKFLVR